MEHALGPDPLIGVTIGNYQIRHKLGEGGMGSVYMAEHPMIGKKVAVKVLHAEFAANEDVVGRFFTEAKSVNDIQHPNIVDIVDYGVIPQDDASSMVYFIMEFLSGKSLADLIHQEAPLPPERALGLCLQIADALAASHEAGIVHRDLKPDNVMLLKRRHTSDFVKVLDFGIAKLTGDQPGSRRTRTGIVMGTPAYMSPEQCEGKGDIDRRTDIYALGILLYEMISGRVPFVGDGYGEVLVQHLTQIPARPTTIRGVIPPHVEMVCMKALEKRPENRYPSMDEFQRALQDPVAYVEAHGGLQGFLHTALVDQGPVPVAAAPAASTGIMVTPAPGSVMGLTPAPGSLTAAGIQTPTTLSGGAGELGASQGGGSRGGLIAIVTVAVLAAGVGGFFALKGGGGDKDTGKADQIAAKPSGTTDKPAIDKPAIDKPAIDKPAIDKPAIDKPAIDKPAIDKPAIDKPAVAAKLEITIESIPSGSSVYIGRSRKAHKAPYSFKVDKSNKTIKVRVKRRGFQTKTKRVTLNETQSVEFRLVPKRGKPSSTKPRPTKPTPTKPKPDTVGDGTMAPGF